jgi:hypothetical protein
MTLSMIIFSTTVLLSTLMLLFDFTNVTAFHVAAVTLSVTFLLVFSTLLNSFTWLNIVLFGVVHKLLRESTYALLVIVLAVSVPLLLEFGTFCFSPQTLFCNTVTIIL